MSRYPKNRVVPVGEYPDFVEAVRRRRVGRPVFSPLNSNVNAVPCDTELDWIIPSYDFPNFFAPGDAALERILDEGIDLFQDGRLHLPFNPVVFIVKRTGSNGFIYRVEESDGEFFLRTYRRFENFYLRLYQARIIPVPSPEQVKFELHMEQEHPETPNICNSGITNTIIATTLLTVQPEKELYRFTSPETEKLRAMNRGRALAKKVLKPLEATRVVHLDVDAVLKIVRSRQGSPGHTKGPHDRRGHKRTLRSGIMIDVRPCGIHGGAPKPKATTVILDCGH